MVAAAQLAVRISQTKRFVASAESIPGMSDAEYYLPPEIHLMLANAAVAGLSQGLESGGSLGRVASSVRSLASNLQQRLSQLGDGKHMSAEQQAKTNEEIKSLRAQIEKARDSSSNDTNARSALQAMLSHLNALEAKVPQLTKTGQVIKIAEVRPSAEREARLELRNRSAISALLAQLLKSHSDNPELAAMLSKFSAQLEKGKDVKIGDIIKALADKGLSAVVAEALTLLSGHSALFQQAIEVLAEGKNPQLAAQIVEALAKNNPELARQTATAIVEVAARISPDLATQTANAIVGTLSKTNSELAAKTAVTIVDTLAKINPELATRAAVNLVDALAKSDPMGAVQTAAVVVNVLSQTNPEITTKFVASLAGTQPEVVRTVLVSLTEIQPIAAQKIVAALAEVDKKSAVHTIIDTLAKTNPAIVQATTLANAESGSSPPNVVKIDFKGVATDSLGDRRTMTDVPSHTANVVFFADKAATSQIITPGQADSVIRTGPQTPNGAGTESVQITTSRSTIVSSPTAEVTEARVHPLGIPTIREGSNDAARVGTVADSVIVERIATLIDRISQPLGDDPRAHPLGIPMIKAPADDAARTDPTTDNSIVGQLKRAFGLCGCGCCDPKPKADNLTVDAQVKAAAVLNVEPAKQETCWLCKVQNATGLTAVVESVKSFFTGGKSGLEVSTAAKEPPPPMANVTMANIKLG